MIIRSASPFSHFASRTARAAGHPVTFSAAVAVVVVAAIQLKLDELIRSTKGAHNALLDLEELAEGHFEELARRARAERRGLLATGSPEVILEVEQP